MAPLGGHLLDKYTNGTLLGTNEGRALNGLVAER